MRRCQRLLHRRAPPPAIRDYSQKAESDLTGSSSNGLAALRAITPTRVDMTIKPYVQDSD
jgi:hypothetical protein